MWEMGFDADRSAEIILGAGSSPGLDVQSNHFEVTLSDGTCKMGSCLTEGVACKDRISELNCL